MNSLSHKIEAKRPSEWLGESRDLSCYLDRIPGFDVPGKIESEKIHIAEPGLLVNQRHSEPDLPPPRCVRLGQPSGETGIQYLYDKRCCPADFSR